MLMQRFIMLKMFMAAVGTSAASLGVISVVAPEKFAAARAKARTRPVSRAPTAPR